MPHLPGFAPKIQRLLCTAPASVKDIHLVARRPKLEKKYSLIQDLMSYFIRSVEDKFANQTLIHSINCSEELIRKLGSYGLSASGLPEVIGGSWKYEEFKMWMKRRCQHEKGLETHVTSESTGDCYALIEPLSAQGYETEKKERKRKLNIVQSRLKRERRKAEWENLKEERRAVEEENVNLRRENQRLERLLSNANAMIALIEGGQGAQTSMWGINSERHTGTDTARIRSTLDALLYQSQSEQCLLQQALAAQQLYSSVSHGLTGQKLLLSNHSGTGSGSVSSHCIGTILGQSGFPPVLSFRSAVPQPACNALASYLKSGDSAAAPLL
jgi:hypothetical protein